MTRFPKPRRKEAKIRRASYLSEIWIETSEQEEQILLWFVRKRNFQEGVQRSIVGRILGAPSRLRNKADLGMK